MEALLGHCLSMPGAVKEYPFGPDPIVMKTGGKMFALIPGDGSSISLKCDPIIAENLRQQYEAITPGYHLNKKHWNSIALDGSVPVAELLDMIDHSYELVLKGMTKAERARIAEAASAAQA